MVYFQDLTNNYNLEVIFPVITTVYVVWYRIFTCVDNRIFICVDFITSLSLSIMLSPYTDLFLQNVKFIFMFSWYCKYDAYFFPWKEASLSNKLSFSYQTKIQHFYILKKNLCDYHLNVILSFVFVLTQNTQVTW